MANNIPIRLTMKQPGPSRNGKTARHNPANYLGFKSVFALEYDLDRLPPQHIITPIFTAEIKFGGKILMQPEHDEPLVKLSNHGFIASREFQAKTVLGDLTGGIDLTWKPGDKKPGFSCNLTRAGHGPIPQIALEEETEGPKFVLTWKPFHGHFHGFEFIASCYADITIKPNEGKNGSSGNDLTRSTWSLPSPRKNNLTASLSRSTFSIPSSNRTIVAHNPLPTLPSTNSSSGMVAVVGVSAGLMGLWAFIAANPEIFVAALAF